VTKQGANDLCACGSGRKFKKCCRGAGDSFSAALARHLQGELAQAAVLYERVLETNPDHAEAFHGLGVIASQLKRHSHAVELLARAAELKPSSAAIHHSLAVGLQAAERWEESANAFARAISLDPSATQSILRLGVTLRLLGRLEDSAACFIRASQMEPDNMDAHNNLGVVRLEQGRLEEAAVNFQRAVGLRPDCAEAHNNLGAVWRTLGKAEAAIAELQRALELQPANADAHYNLGIAWKALDRREQAIAAFGEALRLRPDDDRSEYFLHALKGDVTPAATPASLVANLFDGYAERFDEHLQGTLGYRTPALLREDFDKAGGVGPLDILDLGCGTGLAGVAFRDLAARLCGADLSARMVEKARARGVYNELHVEDLLTALEREAAGFHLVLAADVFVYAGDLDPIFAACSRALKPEGWVLFSVETAEGDSYRLSPSARFQHPPAYVRGVAARHGFAELSSKRVVLRQERGDPVMGEIYLLRL
jgi:predicted TPR repeat methyltransferase